MKSSLYGLYALGYTRVTNIKNKWLHNSNIMLLKINFWLYFASQVYEIEIVSNRSLEWYDEVYLKFAHTAHHARRVEWV